MRTLANRYELTSPIAGGGMGQVWRGHDTLLDRPVAVKVLRDELAADSTFLARFRAEAQHAALLVHPHIAAVFDYGEVHAEGAPPCAYLVLELVDGESLADVLSREGRLDVPRTLHLLRQAADGLAAAHAAGLVHRDVKPANLLVRNDGVLKVTDFGIARSASSVPITQTGQVIGTPHYLAPEQAEGRSSGSASDVYALGAVAYECLSGRRPFEGENPVQVALKQIREEPAPLPPDVPPDVRAVVERAMRKDPAERFPDAAALREALDRVITAGSVAPVGRHGTAVLPVGAGQTAPLSALPPLVSRGRQGRAALLVALGALLAAVVIAVVLLSGGTPTPKAPPAATATTTAGPTTAQIRLSAQQYIGRPVAEVQAALAAQGLDVQLVPVQTAAVPAGQVTAVDPAGTLAKGSVVRVSYAVAPPALPAPQGGHDKKPGKHGDG